MRRIVIVLVITLIIVAGVSSQALSMGNKPPAKKYFVEKYPQISQTTGTVEKVDAGRPSITISTKEYRSLIFMVGAKTQLSKGGKNIKLSEIKKGNIVRVTYEIVYKDINMAKTINVESGNTFESKGKR